MTDQVQAKKILVIEDDTYLRELYLDILKAEGFTIDTAKDGEEGFTKMHTGGYDLVLLDIMLPKMDGITMLQKIVATPPITPNHAVVILSNLGQDSAIAQATALGVRGYIIKSDHTPDQVAGGLRLAPVARNQALP